MIKIDKRKKYIMVLDVETAGGLGNPLIYDIGFAITDKKGNIYAERSYIISEIFDDSNLMNTAYYAEKVPRYLVDLNAGTRIKTTFAEMRIEMFRLVKEYNVKVISAYNLAFDRRALAKTTEYLYGAGIPFIMPEFENLEELCIWSLACEVLYTQPTFRRVAEQECWLTEKGNMQTSAEIGWRYITGDYDFEESHTGLEDVKIETKIMAKCFAQHKKHESGVLANPWRIPNR